MTPDTLSWDFPYPSQRMPVFARNVVAASHPLAAQAGLGMMQKGGNAVDAALAAAITLTVVEPTGNGIGSDAFAIVWDGHRLHGLNGSGRSPKAWTPARFGGCQSMPLTGWDSVTVPGAVDTWATLSKRFGRLEFADLFGPAIGYARHGFVVTPRTAALWALSKDIFKGFSAFADTFLPGGRAPRPGELFRCRDQARTLEEIAETGGESFYRGRLAEKIAGHARDGAAALCAQDLADHRSDWVTPLAQAYGSICLHEIPPNGQGIAALIALGILRQLNLRQYPVDSADSLHLQVEAMKIALAETHRHVADPDLMEIVPEELLDPAFLSRKAGEIRMDRASAPRSRNPSEKGTVCLSAADKNGMMVSYIQSNYLGFGSGIVIPGTGISLQGRACGFNLREGHPNAVAGGKRPYHTIIPGFVTRDGQPLMSFGVMGGHMQPQGHVQMVVRMFDYGQNPQAASDAPRWHVTEDFELALETGTDGRIVEDLARRGHRPAAENELSLFGGAQLIYCLAHGYAAGSDHRKDGQAVGF